MTSNQYIVGFANDPDATSPTLQVQLDAPHQIELTSEKMPRNETGNSPNAYGSLSTTGDGQKEETITGYLRPSVLAKFMRATSGKNIGSPTVANSRKTYDFSATQAGEPHSIVPLISCFTSDGTNVSKFQCSIKTLSIMAEAQELVKFEATLQIYNEISDNTISFPSSVLVEQNKNYSTYNSILTFGTSGLTANDVNSWKITIENNIAITKKAGNIYRSEAGQRQVMVEINSTQTGNAILAKHQEENPAGTTLILGSGSDDENFTINLGNMTPSERSLERSLGEIPNEVNMYEATPPLISGSIVVGQNDTLVTS